MTRNNKKNALHSIHSGPSSGRTRITAPVLDRLIKEKMARTPECDGVAALGVGGVAGRAGEWRIPGYTGDASRISRCEAAIREYLEFLAGQFDLADD